MKIINKSSLFWLIENNENKSSSSSSYINNEQNKENKNHDGDNISTKKKKKTFQFHSSKINTHIYRFSWKNDVNIDDK